MSASIVLGSSHVVSNVILLIIRAKLQILWWVAFRHQSRCCLYCWNVLWWSTLCRVYHIEFNWWFLWLAIINLYLLRMRIIVTHVLLVVAIICQQILWLIPGGYSQIQFHGLPQVVCFCHVAETLSLSITIYPDQIIELICFQDAPDWLGNAVTQNGWGLASHDWFIGDHGLYATWQQWLLLEIPQSPKAELVIVSLVLIQEFCGARYGSCSQCCCFSHMDLPQLFLREDALPAAHIAAVEHEIRASS